MAYKEGFVIFNSGSFVPQDDGDLHSEMTNCFNVCLILTTSY